MHLLGSFVNMKRYLKLRFYRSPLSVNFHNKFSMHSRFIDFRTVLCEQDLTHTSWVQLSDILLVLLRSRIVDFIRRQFSDTEKRKMRLIWFKTYVLYYLKLFLVNPADLCSFFFFFPIILQRILNNVLDSSTLRFWISADH